MQQHWWFERLMRGPSRSSSCRTTWSEFNYRLTAAAEATCSWLHLLINDAHWKRIHTAELTGELHLHDTNRLPMRNNQICGCYLMRASFGNPDCGAPCSALILGLPAHTHTHSFFFLRYPFKLGDCNFAVGGSCLLASFIKKGCWLLSRSLSHLLSPPPPQISLIS